MKKYDVITELLSHVFYEMAKLSVMGRKLEKEHKTKIVAAEICLFAANGEIVYKFWNVKRTRKYIPALTRAFAKEGAELTEEARKAMAGGVPFAGLLKIKETE